MTLGLYVLGLYVLGLYILGNDGLFTTCLMHGVFTSPQYDEAS